MRDALWSVLAHYPAALRPSSEPESLGHAGGLSGALFWRYAAGRRLLVVRAWPPDGPPRPALERVHAWLAVARDLDFIPVPIPGLDGRTLREQGGRFWELAPWLPGEPASQGPPDTGNVTHAFAGLAAFHQRLAGLATPGPSPAVLARLEEVEHLQVAGFETIGKVLVASAQGPLTDLAARWHATAAELAPAVLDRLKRAARLTVGRQPCLRDARPEHFLFEGGRLTALVDFGAMAEETVAADLARLSAEWLGQDNGLRQDALRAYTAIRPLGEAELALIPVIEDASSLLTAARWVRWHFLEGRPFDDPTAVLRGLEKGVERVARLASPAGKPLQRDSRS
jgi:Ser/Thr protein kinase RdoA (MazF antagonist)